MIDDQETPVRRGNICLSPPASRDRREKWSDKLAALLDPLFFHLLPPVEMNHFRPSWFTESGVINSDSINLSVRVDGIVHQEKSQYQNVLVFDR